VNAANNPLRGVNAIVRVAVLDHHPALRAGLDAILTPEPDLVAVGSAANEEQVWPLVRRTRPDVIVLDLHHPGRDGLTLWVSSRAPTRW
jgi:DNA-binding NarL/FixJ family response regulator